MRYRSLNLVTHEQTTLGHHRTLYRHRTAHLGFAFRASLTRFSVWPHSTNGGTLFFSQAYFGLAIRFPNGALLVCLYNIWTTFAWGIFDVYLCWADWHAAGGYWAMIHVKYSWRVHLISCSVLLLANLLLGCTLSMFVFSDLLLCSQWFVIHFRMTQHRVSAQSKHRYQIPCEAGFGVCYWTGTKNRHLWMRESKYEQEVSELVRRCINWDGITCTRKDRRRRAYRR